MPASPKSNAPQPVEINLYRRLAVLALAALVVVIITFFSVLKLKQEAMMHFGLASIIMNLEGQISRNPNLSVYQSAELVGYLESLRKFVRRRALTRETLVRYHRVITPIKQALAHGRVTPQEMAVIRETVWDANLEEKEALPAASPAAAAKAAPVAQKPGSRK